MKNMTRLLVVAALFTVAALVASGLNYDANVYATKDLYKSAKEMFGKDIKGCKHCHEKSLPKEDSADLNERGEWLAKQKEEKGVDEIDVSWLKDYQP